MLAVQQSYLERRPRVDVRIQALLIESDGCMVGVEVLDVSSSGFRVHTGAELIVEEEVMLQMARSLPVRAKICWTRGSEAGGIFLDPVEDMI